MITLFAASAITAVVAAQTNNTTMDIDCLFYWRGTCYENMADLEAAVIED